MHRHRVVYNGVYTHYPYSYTVPEPLPVANVNVCVPSYCPTYTYPCCNYIPRPIATLPPIVQTNVHKDVRYYYDDPGVMYTDVYGYPYRLSRSKVQLVDVVPRNNVRTYRPREISERIIVPRATAVRSISLPPYERPKPVRVVPLYHSANPDYIVTSRI